MNDNQPTVPLDIALLAFDLGVSCMEATVYQERLKQFRNLSPYKIIKKEKQS